MRIVALSLLFCLTGMSQAAQMPIAAMPGGNLVFKHVQSIRERRFADIVEQKTDFSCGAAALATILRQAYWLDVNEDQIIKGMLQNADQDLVRTQGFSMLDMKRYVESIGMRARGYRIPAQSLESVNIPVVVLLDKTNALLTPPAPLTAKNQLDGFSPVKDAELMDFGFIQSDFF